MTVRTVDKSLTFIHIPKTGGTSIVQWMRTNLECDTYKPKHCTLKYFEGKYGPTGFSFTVVRNPWEILVSAYHYNKRLQKERYHKSSVHKKSIKNWSNIRIQQSINFYEAGFTHFILSGQKHWHPYTELQAKYTHGVDYIIRYENLHNDFKQIQDRVNCHEPLPRLNTSDHKHYRKYYNKLTKGLVAEAFRIDIGMFEYEF